MRTPASHTSSTPGASASPTAATPVSVSRPVFHLLRRRLMQAGSALTVASALLALGALDSTAQAADPNHPKLVLGATAGYNYDVLKKAIRPQLEKQGYAVKLVEFNDYVQPNLALAEGSLDANLFQHITYLKRFAEDRKLDVVELVQSTTAPMGIYSERVDTLERLEAGDTVTLPNDPANLARALQLLAGQKLITLRASTDPLRVTQRDVEKNPKRLRFMPVEAAQLPRTLGDATLAIVPGNYATSAGLDFTKALLLEAPPVAYQQVVAVRRADLDAPWARDLKESFRSEAFRQALEKDFPGYVRPAGL